MNLTSPLTSIMRVSDAAVLEVLARTVSPLSGRQIARLAESKSPGNVRSALLRLADVGLVIVAPRPDAVLYSANRSHLLWQSIELALQSLPRLERYVQAYTSKHNYDDVSVILYGSVARGESDAASDIDLLVIHRESRSTQLVDSFADGLRDGLDEITGNTVQIFQLKPSELRQMNQDQDPIVRAWVTDGRALVGKSLDYWLRAS